MLQGHQALFNTLSALVQVAIGLGLLCRRTVKPAIGVVVRAGCWWCGGLARRSGCCS